VGLAKKVFVTFFEVSAFSVGWAFVFVFLLLLEMFVLAAKALNSLTVLFPLFCFSDFGFACF
jgi:hypothetical protein